MLFFRFGGGAHRMTILRMTHILFLVGCMTYVYMIILSANKLHARAKSFSCHFRVQAFGHSKETSLLLLHCSKYHTIHMNDHATLDETSRLQNETKAAIARMRRQADETHQVGVATLENLQEQRQTIARVNNEAERLNTNLDRTEKLQNKLSRWTLTFNRKKAQRQAKEDLGLQETQKERLKSAKTAGDKFKERLEQPRKQNEMTKSILSPETKKDRPETPSWKPQNKHTPLSRKQKEQLKEIEAADQAIDSALEGVDHQLDALLNIANQNAEEMRAQEPDLENIYDSVERAHQKQTTANIRARGFFTGRRNDK